MPKHLYTLPAGTVLPDPAGSPEGYPFVLEEGTGSALKQTLYAIKAGAYAKLGGSGGGSVGFGPLIPVVTGAPFIELQADQDTSVGGAGYPSVPRNGTPQQVEVNSFDTIIDAPSIPTGATFTKAWLLGQAYNSDLSFGDYALSFTLPYFDDPHGDAQASACPAYRINFRYDPPTNYQQEKYIVGLQAEAYDPANVGRVVTNWAERRNPDPSDGRLHGGDGDDRFDGGMIWFNGSPYGGDYSVTVPAGSNYIDFIVYQTDPAFEVPPGASNSHAYSGAISNVTIELLAPAEAPGALFVEESTGQIWLYDNSILLSQSTDSPSQGDRGAGWYPITPVQLFDVRSNEFEHLSDYGSRYYIGNHLFSSAQDMNGNVFGTAKNARTPIPFHGALAPTRPGATTLGNGFGFVDRFLGPDQPSNFYPHSSVDNGTAVDPPPAPASMYTQTYGGHLNPGVPYYYRYVCFDSFGGHVASAEASYNTAATSSFVNAINFNMYPLVGTDHIKVYRGTASGNEKEIATIPSSVFPAYPSAVNFTDSYPLVPINNSVPADNGFSTAFSHKGRFYSLADYARIIRDDLVSDVDIEVDYDYAFDYSLSNPIWSVRFRGTGDFDYFEFAVDPRAGTPAWTLSSVVASTPTVLASGTYTFLQPFTLGVKAVGDQVLLRTSDATGRLNQVLLDDFTAATHTLNTDHAGGTWAGFCLPKGGAATYYVDHLSTSPNSNGTDIKLDYNGYPDGCFVVPPGLDTQNGGAIPAYTTWTKEGLGGVTITAKLVRRKQSNYGQLDTLQPTLYMFGSSGLSSSNTINTTDGADRKLQSGDLLDLYVNIPSTLNQAALHLIWTLYMGGIGS